MGLLHELVKLERFWGVRSRCHLSVQQPLLPLDASMQRERQRNALLSVLTFVTGILDGVGYVALDHVFAGMARV